MVVLHAFVAANSDITCERSTFQAITFLTNRVASKDGLLSPMVDFKNVFLSFNFKKFSSWFAIGRGMIYRFPSDIHMFGKFSWCSLL